MPPAQNMHTAAGACSAQPTLQHTVACTTPPRTQFRSDCNTNPDPVQSTLQMHVGTPQPVQHPALDHPQSKCKTQEVQHKRLTHSQCPIQNKGNSSLPCSTTHRNSHRGLMHAPHKGRVKTMQARPHTQTHKPNLKPQGDDAHGTQRQGPNHACSTTHTQICEYEATGD